MAILARTNKRVTSGNCCPLGAELSGAGVNFALYSRSASAVFLLLFDSAAGEPTDIIPMRARTKFVWHCFVHGIKAGQLYGYKVVGEFNPAQGLRFNEH